jgi:hypothetical protein
MYFTAVPFVRWIRVEWILAAEVGALPGSSTFRHCLLDILAGNVDPPPPAPTYLSTPPNLR